LAEDSDSLVAGSAGEFIAGDNSYQIPRFIYMGPTGGGDTIRLAIMAAIHGDEPEGAEAVVAFLQELERDSQAARGFHIYAYPICNPTGFIRRTRANASGQVLSQEFWRKSTQPEVYYLEREIGVLQFHGVIELQTDSSGHRFAANTCSPILSQALAKPAIESTHHPLAVTRGTSEAALDGASFYQNNEAADFLTATNELSPAPFELRLRIPRQLSRQSQIQGTVDALKSILHSFRNLQSISQNI
jgi:hypothetical protein